MNNAMAPNIKRSTAPHSLGVQLGGEAFRFGALAL